MALTDPLGDMLTRIRNGLMRGKSKISTPNSKLRAVSLLSQLHRRVVQHAL